MIQENKIPWLKDVNITWQCFQVKRGFETLLGKMLQPTQRNSDDIEVPYLKALHIHWDGIKFEDLPKMWANQSEIEQLSLKQGDLIVCEGGEVGRGTILNHQLPSNCIIQNSLHRVRNKELGETRFLRYILQSASDIGWLDVLCNRATIRHFTVEKFSEFWIAAPSKNEQKLIADYLDRETTQIDNLIAAKEQMLTLLEEKREALISQAVTRGLDPNVAFKRSGLDWLGDIPKHWQVSKAKFVSDIFVPQRNKPELNTEDGIPWLTMEDMQSKRVSNTSFKVSQEASKLAGSKILKRGSVIASCVGNFGICTINDVDLIINQQLQAFIPHKHIMAEYFCELVRVSTNYFKMIGTSVTIVYVNQLGFENMPVLIPPKEEQEQIVEHLNREIGKIDELLAAIKESIALLKERRSALITAAVTGQISIQEKSKHSQNEVSQ